MANHGRLRLPAQHMIIIFTHFARKTGISRIFYSVGRLRLLNALWKSTKLISCARNSKDRNISFISRFLFCLWIQHIEAPISSTVASRVCYHAMSTSPVWYTHCCSLYNHLHRFHRSPSQPVCLLSSRIYSYFTQDEVWASIKLSTDATMGGQDKAHNKAALENTEGRRNCRR